MASQAGISRNSETKEILISQIASLEARIKKIEAKYEWTRNDKQRIEKIVNLCHKNKSQNEEWIRDLTYLLTNYNKLIELEANDIRAQKRKIASIQKIALHYIELYEEKTQNHSDLVNSIKQSLKNKQNFTINFNNADSLIEKSVMSTANKLEKFSIESPVNKGLKRNNTMAGDKSKVFNEKIEEMKIFNDKIEEVLQNSGPDFHLSPAFIRFKELHEKSLELKGTAMVQKDRVLIMERQLEDRKKSLQVRVKLVHSFKHIFRI